jgi:glycosyltransferase A (GT-A) superfamily protein (DUF2064 family)
MRHAVDAHFAEGARAVVVIGADAPDVGAATVTEAVRVLGGSDVVLGPAEDGGYYLMALARPVPALFEGIPWGTGRVLQVTLEVCERLHLTVAKLSSLRDLDTEEDLIALGLD